jgi:hypothetical protein
LDDALSRHVGAAASCNKIAAGRLGRRPCVGLGGLAWKTRHYRIAAKRKPNSAAEQEREVAGQFSVLLVLSLMGLGLNSIIVFARKRVLFWDPSQKTTAQAPAKGGTV